MRFPGRFSRTIAWLPLLVTIFSISCTEPPEARKEKHLQRGKAYFDDQKYHEATIEFRNVVQLDPTNAAAHYQLALAYMKLGGRPNLEAAFAELTKTVELDKTHADAHLKLSEFYLMSGQTAKARENVDAVLAVAPDSLEALTVRGQSLVNDKDYLNGIIELKKAVALEPKRLQARLLLARAYMLKQDVSAAEATLMEAIVLDPQSVDAHTAMGDFRVATKQFGEAETEYKRAVELNPERNAGYIKLASFYYLRHQWADLERVHHDFINKKPNDDKPQELLGDFYLYAGLGRKAETAYRRAIEINPKSVSARDKLILLHLDMRQIDAAQTLINPMREKDPKDVSSRLFDGRLRLARGKTDEAIPIFEGILKEDPRHVGAHESLGLAYLRQRDLPRANAELTEAAKLAPNRVETHIALATVFLLDGSPDLALEQSKIAFQLNPMNPRNAALVADSYLAKGDTQNAKKVLEQIVRAIPQESGSHYRLGVIALSEKKQSAAFDHFEEAVTGDPTNIQAVVQISGILIAQNKLPAARERVLKQLTATPNNPALYALLGQLWMLSKDPGQAEAAYKKAIAVDDAYALGYMNLAQLYASTNRLDAAIQEFETALVKQPNLLSARIVLGSIYELRKDYVKARSQYEAALKINPKSAPTANNLAFLMAEHGGDLDAALNYAQIAREQAPEDPHVADTLGWILYKKNAYLKAVALLREASEKLSEVPEVRYHYGMAQFKGGDPAGAKRSLEAALKISQTFAGAEEAKLTLPEVERQARIAGR